MKNKRIYRWECHHESGRGLDRECCRCKGGWSTLETAIKNGQNHNKKHRYSGWGYPSLDWQNQTVNIYRKTPTGKIKLEIAYDELNKINV